MTRLQQKMEECFYLQMQLTKLQKKKKKASNNL